MKKITLLTLLAFCAAAPASAQLAGYGLKAGLNISDFAGSDVSGARSARAGLAIGGWLLFPVRGVPFSIQAECLYTVKGTTYKFDVLGDHAESRVRLSYLEFPVLARFDLKSRSGAKPALLIGPAFAFKVADRAEYRTVGTASGGGVQNVKNFDPGIVLGALAEIPAGAGAITLEARYTRSLVTIMESGGGETPDVKNSVASLLLGYRF